jgi:hypothetical protein
VNYMRIRIILAVLTMMLPVASGEDLQEFGSDREPFASNIPGLAEGLRGSMLSTLSGIIEGEKAVAVLRITAIGAWGVDIYSFFYDADLSVISVTHSYLQVEDRHKKLSVMVSQRFPIDSDVKKLAAAKFKWSSYREVADQIKTGDLKSMGGDDLPFVLVEHLNKGGNYSGIYFPPTFHQHIKMLEHELGGFAKELRAGG